MSIISITPSTTSVVLTRPTQTLVTTIPNTSLVKGEKGDSYTSLRFNFNTPSNLWIVNHNKGYYPNILVMDIFNRIVMAEVEHFSLNQVRVHFSSDQIGKIIVN